MATRRNPRFKECRRLGVNVCGHPKAMNRANDPAFKKTKKTSEYGKQLCEKQKVKAYYGIMERQLRRYYDIASRKDGKTLAAIPHRLIVTDIFWVVGLVLVFGFLASFVPAMIASLKDPVRALNG